MRVRSVSSLVLSAVVAVSLAGCSGAAYDPPASSAAPTVVATPTVSTTPTPTATEVTLNGFDLADRVRGV